MSRKWVDKKRDKTYKVVFRGHDDPLYHDTDASEHVLMPVEHKKQQQYQQKIKNKTQLEAELGDALEEMRENEGEAALYGIPFDDSKYDYLQHLKPMGGEGEGVFIPVKEAETKSKNKSGITFKEDVELPDDVFQSKTTVKTTYQDQQNFQDEIAGFKPDMNPALREVLEALEDEAYVDDDDAVFDDLLQGGAAGDALDEDEFEDQFDEWDMDNYEDEMAQYDDEHFTEEGDQGWEAGFRKYKAMSKFKQNDWDSDNEFDDDEDDDKKSGKADDEDEDEDEGDVLAELPSFKNVQNKSKSSKRKERRKKGAMSDTSSFSMSSSALVRSESLRLLDDRFEQVIKKYEEDAENLEEDEEYKPFDMATERDDFEGMLDEFLDTYEIEGGRRLVKKSEEIKRMKEAADSVSRGKLAQKRNKERAEEAKKGSLGGLTGNLNNLRL